MKKYKVTTYIIFLIVALFFSGIAIAKASGVFYYDFLNNQLVLGSNLTIKSQQGAPLYLQGIHSLRGGSLIIKSPQDIQLRYGISDAGQATSTYKFGINNGANTRVFDIDKTGILTTQTTISSPASLGCVLSPISSIVNKFGLGCLVTNTGNKYVDIKNPVGNTNLIATGANKAGKGAILLNGTNVFYGGTFDWSSWTPNYITPVASGNLWTNDPVGVPSDVSTKSGGLFGYTTNATGGLFSWLTGAGDSNSKLLMSLQQTGTVGDLTVTGDIKDSATGQKYEPAPPLGNVATIDMVQKATMGFGGMYSDRISIWGNYVPDSTGFGLVPQAPTYAQYSNPASTCANGKPNPLNNGQCGCPTNYASHLVLVRNVQSVNTIALPGVWDKCYSSGCYYDYIRVFVCLK